MMQTMTSTERLAARMRGEPVDRIPNMSLVMQFAADQIGKPLAQYYQDHHVLVQANYKTIELLSEYCRSGKTKGTKLLL